MALAINFLGVLGLSGCCNLKCFLGKCFIYEASLCSQASGLFLSQIYSFVNTKLFLQYYVIFFFFILNNHDDGNLLIVEEIGYIPLDGVLKKWQEKRISQDKNKTWVKVAKFISL